LLPFAAADAAFAIIYAAMIFSVADTPLPPLMMPYITSLLMLLLFDAIADYCRL